MTVDWTQLPPPQPAPDLDTQGFWDATARGELELCRCQSCGLWHHPPREHCRRCAAATAFEPIGGRGSIHTFIVQRQPAVVGFFDKVPYAVAIVELDEQPGLRLTGRVADIGVDDVHIGLRVAARLDALPGGDFRVPVFIPSPDESDAS
jgi:uncharacterized OB-fold protein